MEEATLSKRGSKKGHFFLSRTTRGKGRRGRKSRAAHLESEKDGVSAVLRGRAFPDLP